MEIGASQYALRNVMHLLASFSFMKCVRRLVTLIKLLVQGGLIL